MKRWLALWSLMMGLVALTWTGSAGAQERCPSSISGTLDALSPTQQGRLQGGGGGASACGANKPVPQLLAPQQSYAYKATTFRNRSQTAQCVTVAVTSTSGGGIQSAAYLGTYTPANPTLNYLGDGGGNATLSTITYGVTVPALSNFVVVVSSVTGNAASGFDLNVTGCGAVVVTGIDPNAGSAAGGTNATVRGSGFLAGATVTIGGALASNITVVDEGTIGLTTPAGVEGPADVVVTNQDATTSTLAGGFLYTSASATTLSLTSSKNPSVFGQAVTFTAKASAGAGVPAGSVSFFDGAAKIGDANLVVGTATFTTTSLATGTHSIVATYGGGGGLGAAISAAVTQQVVRADTTTTLGSSKNPSGSGESVTLTAQVTAVAPGGGVPSGDVTFSDGGTPLVTVTLDNTGKASFSTSGLIIGNHELVATFLGGPTHAASVSAKLTQSVGLPSTATALVSSKNPSFIGDEVTFTATVTAIAGGGVPTGTVTFYDGSKVLASRPLDAGGRATFSIGTLTEGGHAMNAIYEGSPSFATSNSSIIGQNVLRDSSVSSSSSSSSGGAADAGASAAPGDGAYSAEGGGCDCREAPARASDLSVVGLAFAAFLAVTRRGRRARR